MRLLVVLPLLAACERADDPGAARLVMPPHVDVVVFEPGREPRAPLNAAPVSGQFREELVVTTKFRGIPDRHLRETAASEVVVDGARIHHRQRIESIAVDPVPAGYDPQTLVGTTTEGWTDRRGVWLGPAISHSRFTEHGARRIELELVAPEPPVGVGARWRETISDGAVQATTTVELVGRDHGHVTLHATYHREDPTSKTPFAVDGTATLELDEDRLGGAMRGSNEIRPLAPSAPVVGTETFELRDQR